MFSRRMRGRLKLETIEGLMISVSHAWYSGAMLADPLYSPPRYAEMRLSDAKGSSETCADVSRTANPWR